MELYQELLSNIVSIWNSKFDSLNIDDDPKTALTAYICSKVMYSRDDPDASRIFASEIIHGAPVLNDYLSSDFKIWVQTKVDVIHYWIKQELIDDINPHHLLFLIWGPLNIMQTLMFRYWLLWIKKRWMNRVTKLLLTQSSL
jgi:TetR/AcrR family transcriptional regulator